MIQEQYDNLPVNFSLTLSIGIEGHARQRFQNEPIMRPRCVGQWNSSDTQPLQQRRGRLDDRHSRQARLISSRGKGSSVSTMQLHLLHFPLLLLFSSSPPPPPFYHLRSTTFSYLHCPSSSFAVALLLLLLPSRKYSRTVIGRSACAPSEHTCARIYKCTRMKDVYVRARSRAYSVHACE